MSIRFIIVCALKTQLYLPEAINISLLLTAESSCTISSDHIFSDLSTDQMTEMSIITRLISMQWSQAP